MIAALDDHGFDACACLQHHPHQANTLDMALPTFFHISPTLCSAHCLPSSDPPSAIKRGLLMEYSQKNSSVQGQTKVLLVVSGMADFSAATSLGFAFDAKCAVICIMSQNDMTDNVRCWRRLNTDHLEVRLKSWTTWR
jgi:hypothetical protein